MKLKTKRMYDNFIIFTIGAFIIMGNSSTIDLSGGMLYKGLPFKITDLCFLLIVLKNLKLTKKIKKLENYFLIAWIIWGMISIFLNAFIYEYTFVQIRYGILYPIRIIIYILAICKIIENLKERFDFIQMMNKINFYYTITCVIGILQYLFYPIAFDFYDILKKLNIYILNPDPHHNRLFGTYLDPNFLGSIMVFPVGLTLAEIFTSRYKKRQIVKIIQLIFQILIVILTSSRSGILGIFIVLLIFFIMEIKNINKKIKKLFFIIFLGGGSLILIALALTFDKIRVFKRIIDFQEDPSAQARFSSFGEALNQIKDNFMIGTGYNMMGFYTGDTTVITGFGTNSSWLFVFITTGLIGILIFIGYFSINLYKVYKYRKKENYFYANSIIAITIASFITANFNNLLFYPLWIVVYIFINEFYFKTYKINIEEISL
ncbi:MAG: O-antigen ligase family protein [Cetobacterium sp.]